MKKLAEISENSTARLLVIEKQIDKLINENLRLKAEAEISQNLIDKLMGDVATLTVEKLRVEKQLEEVTSS